MLRSNDKSTCCLLAVRKFYILEYIMSSYKASIVVTEKKKNGSFLE